MDARVLCLSPAVKPELQQQPTATLQLALEHGIACSLSRRAVAPAAAACSAARDCAAPPRAAAAAARAAAGGPAGPPLRRRRRRHCRRRRCRRPQQCRRQKRRWPPLEPGRAAPPPAPPPCAAGSTPPPRPRSRRGAPGCALCTRLQRTHISVWVGHVLPFSCPDIFYPVMPSMFVHVEASETS